MPRSNRRRPDDAAPAPRSAAVDAAADWRGVPYTVRQISGSSGKTYRCPGCDQEIQPAVPHVVGWPSYDSDAADRRHWHTACWAAREQRAPRVQRSRDAPRY